MDRIEQAKDRVLFEQRLAGFIQAAQVKKDAYLKGFESADGRYKPTPEPITVKGGVKWIKLVVPGSVYCFVNSETGDVHKAAGYNQPVKNNPRSNIFDDDYGSSGVNGHGPVYLR